VMHVFLFSARASYMNGEARRVASSIPGSDNFGFEGLEYIFVNESLLKYCLVNIQGIASLSNKLTKYAEGV
jgi:hypothetical protein